MPECEQCRFYFTDEQLDEPRCEHPVHFGTVTILPACSTARDKAWWGKEACGPEARHWEPCE